MLRLLRAHGSTDYCPDKSDAKARPSPFEDSHQGTGGDGAFWITLSPLSRNPCKT
jgi:hypothetical protein